MQVSLSGIGLAILANVLFAISRRASRRTGTRPTRGQTGLTAPVLNTISMAMESVWMGYLLDVSWESSLNSRRASGGVSGRVKRGRHWLASSFPTVAEA